MRRIIEDYLIQNGVCASVVGFTYLVDAVEMYSPFIGVTKDIYTTIGKKYKINKHAVERGILYAIKKSGVQMSNGEYFARARLMCDRICEDKNERMENDAVRAVRENV